MTLLFISYAQEDAACAEQIRQGLEAKGYSVWRDPQSLDTHALLYPRTIENVILESAGVVLLWSRSAAPLTQMIKHMLFAQRLKKLLLPMLLDRTPLPKELIPGVVITGQPSCTDNVSQLLLHLPPPHSADPIAILCEKAAHEYIRERKKAIDYAAEMLQDGKEREAVVAVLEYLASSDMVMGVREKAQQVLNADAKKLLPLPAISQSPHSVRVVCPNGHVTYFDKRQICCAGRSVFRTGKKQSSDIVLDEFALSCGTCNAKLTVYIDCENYL